MTLEYAASAEDNPLCHLASIPHDAVHWPSKSIMVFTALPQEILVEILAYLDYRSVFRCAYTCRLLYEICKRSVELQYILELALDGFKTAVVNAPYSDLLSRLHDLRLSWADAEWKQFSKVEIKNTCVAYELVAGVFAMSDGQGLSVTWLPSSAMGGRSLEVPLLGILVRDFAMDPTQDLIIILEDDHIPISFTEARHVRLHVRTISANEPHPLASRAVLEFDMNVDDHFGNGIFTALLEIAIDVVALFINKGAISNKPRLLIWNWRNGALIYDSESIGETLSRTIYHFSLLSRGSFILTSTRRPGALHLYSFDPTSSALSIPELCATLHLPPIHTYCSVLQLVVHSGPISSGHAETTTFSASLESHLLVLSVIYSIHADDAPSSASYRIFVHKRTFLDQVARYRQAKVSKGVAARSADVDWSNWGEMNTRFVATQSTRIWLRYVHGQRVISNSEDSDSVEVLNFNIPSLSSVNATNSHLHDEPSSQHPAYLFQNDFVTRLPYYSTTRAVGESFYACMIDEERIVGLKMPDTDVMKLYIYAF